MDRAVIDIDTRSILMSLLRVRLFRLERLAIRLLVDLPDYCLSSVPYWNILNNNGNI